MTNLEKINSIKNRLGGMYLYLKEKPERLQEAQVRERIKRLAEDFNEVVDELLYPDKSQEIPTDNSFDFAERLFSSPESGGETLS